MELADHPISIPIQKQDVRLVQGHYQYRRSQEQIDRNERIEINYCAVVKLKINAQVTQKKSNSWKAHYRLKEEEEGRNWQKWHKNGIVGCH